VRFVTLVNLQQICSDLLWWSPIFSIQFCHLYAHNNESLLLTQSNLVYLLHFCLLLNLFFNYYLLVSWYHGVITVSKQGIIPHFSSGNERHANEECVDVYANLFQQTFHQYFSFRIVLLVIDSQSINVNLGKCGQFFYSCPQKNKIVLFTTDMLTEDYYKTQHIYSAQKHQTHEKHSGYQ